MLFFCSGCLTVQHCIATSTQIFWLRKCCDCFATDIMTILRYSLTAQHVLHISDKQFVLHGGMLFCNTFWPSMVKVSLKKNQKQPHKPRRQGKTTNNNIILPNKKQGMRKLTAESTILMNYIRTIRSRNQSTRIFL